MCGRYAQTADMRQLMEAFEAGPSASSLALNWNIAPTNPIYIVRAQNPSVIDPDGIKKYERTLATVSWGLIGPWITDAQEARASQSRAINARSESIHEKPTFRNAFRQSRCLIPASGYYEWATALGQYSPKQPFYIHARDNTQLSIAGIWSRWISGSGEITETASIITQEAQGELSLIHNRMPVFMPRNRWDLWLDPANTQVEELKALMQVQAPDSIVVAHPVSNAVNSIKNNGQELTNEIPLGEPETLF